MIRIRLCLAASAAVLTYLCLGLVFSPYGILEYRRHSEFADRVRAGVAELESENARLLGRINELRTQSDAVILEGRGIGLYRENEGVIRLVGVPSPNFVGERSRPGRITRRISPGPNNYPWMRAVAISAGLLVLVVPVQRERHKKRKALRQAKLPTAEHGSPSHGQSAGSRPAEAQMSFGSSGKPLPLGGA